MRLLFPEVIRTIVFFAKIVSAAIPHIARLGLEDELMVILYGPLEGTCSSET